MQMFLTQAWIGFRWIFVNDICEWLLVSVVLSVWVLGSVGLVVCDWARGDESDHPIISPARPSRLPLTAQRKQMQKFPRPKRTQPYKLPAILSLAFRTSNLRRFIGKALHRLSYVKINNEFCAIRSANPMMTRYASVRFQKISTDKEFYEQFLSFLYNRHKNRI